MFFCPNEGLQLFRQVEAHIVRAGFDLSGKRTQDSFEFLHVERPTEGGLHGLAPDDALGIGLDPNVSVVVFDPHVFVRVVFVDRVNGRVRYVPGTEHRADFVIACLFTHICPRNSYPNALWLYPHDVYIDFVMLDFDGIAGQFAVCRIDPSARRDIELPHMGGAGEDLVAVEIALG